MYTPSKRFKRDSLKTSPVLMGSPNNRNNSNSNSPTSSPYSNLNSEELIQNFQNLYNECRQARSTTRNADAVFDRLSKKFSKNLDSSNDEKMVIAFFGGSGLHKSSSINFLLSGNFDSPLPNSDTSGCGVTTTPIRCEYHIEQHDNYILKLYADKQIQNEEILNANEIKDCLEQVNQCDKYDEILLQVPLKQKPKQSPFPDNIQFLDLIGTEVNMDAKSLKDESPGVRKNRNSIQQREIHCVFIFSKERGKCTPEIIRNLWDIDVFSNLRDKCKPKLVMFDIIQAWRKTQEEIEMTFRSEGIEQCTKSIQVSLIQAFDFDLNPNSNKNVNDSKQLELPIMHKSLVIPELYKNSSTCFLLEQNGLISPNTLEVLTKITQSISHIIHDNKNLLILESAVKLLVEIRQKLKNKLNGQTSLLTRALIKFFETKLYAKLKIDCDSKIDNIIETMLDNVIFKDIMEPLVELNVDEESKNYKLNSYEAIDFRINEIYEEFIMDHVFYFMDYTKRLEQCLRQYLIKNKNIEHFEIQFFSDFNAEYLSWRIENVLKDSLKNELTRFIHEKIINDHSDETRILDEFNRAKESLKQTLDMKECIVDSSSENSNTKELTALEDKLRLLKEKMEAKIFNLVGEETEFKYDHYEIREPCLSASENTLKFPILNSKCDTLSDCFKNKWLKSQKSDLKANNLLEEGRQKSQILKNNQFVHSELSDDLLTEVNQLKIETFVQIYIDRENKKVKFEYDAKKINEKIQSLVKNVTDLDSDGLSTHLYPIFMSSVQREANFTPNILVKDLCHSDSSIKNFLIFLFIEAGTPQERFEQTINYYVELTNSIYNNTNKKLSENPIILCFLPEKNMGIGRKRKLMILFAEWLNLNRFYLCDDDIDQFYIYDPRPQFRLCRTHPLAASKAFAYMCHVMDWAIEGLDFQLNEQTDPLTRKQILGLIQKLGDVKTDNEEAKDLIESILFDKSYVKQKDYLFYLLRKLGDEGKEIEKELKDLLLNERAKVLGQVGLWNQNANSMRATITSRLQGNNRTTHAISKIRYQLVLYNMHAMNSIHPISDDALFEETLREQDKEILCSKIENKNFDNKDACRAARQGYRYSDKAHVYYQILNRVSGYLVYYFSFTSMRNIESKVNGKKNQ